MSSLSDALKRSSDILKSGASAQVSDYEQRFLSLGNLYDDLLGKLMKTDLNALEDYQTALEFFGTDRVRFAGIVGTMY